MSTDAKEKGLDELAIDSSTFDALEKDFQDVLQMLVGDNSLDKFRLEFEKLHRALKKSHDEEKRLIAKCRELNTEIVNNAAKVQTALKLSQDDQNTIASLKKEIQKAWKMVDASHEKELRAKETISQLKTEITRLSQLVEEGAGLSVGQENTVKELLKVKEDLSQQLSDAKETNDELNKRIEGLVSTLEQKRAGTKDLEETIENLKLELETSKSREARETRHKERLDKDLRELRQTMESKNVERDALLKSIADSESKISKLEEQVRRTRDAMEKYARDYEALKNDSLKLQEEKEEQASQNTQLTSDIRKAQQGLNEKQIELNRQEQNLRSVKRQLEQQTKATGVAEEEMTKMKLELESYKRTMNQLQSALDEAKKHEDFMEREKTMLERERDRVKITLAGQEAATKEEETKVVQGENEIRAIESELSNYKREILLLEGQIRALEREREKFGSELSAEHQKYISVTEELKMKEVLEGELNKKIAEGEVKLKQQQQLYEAVRSDRNLYSKNLMEAQDEIAELKRKFKIMTHQIEQLKEEISIKDNTLVREQLGRKKAEKLHEHTKQELGKRQALLEEAEKTLDKQHQEISKLTRCIATMDEDALRQRKEYDQVVNERDILGTQLIRRNDELALLYEKIKILQFTIKKGENQYEERLEDITALRLKIQDLLRELGIHMRKTGQLNDMKKEIFQLQRELLQEKTKVKALSEELENPMNVHRWRKLEGSDPATFEMIQKIQTLQKRLIVKTEQVVEKDLLIKEKEKLYEELKGILSRQPGPEVVEQLNVYQHNLKEKTRQMKVLAAELNMSQSQVNEFKFEIEKLNQDIQNIKRQYYEQKKREQQLRDSLNQGYNPIDASYQRALQQATDAAAAASRFTGGGFNLSASRKD